MLTSISMDTFTPACIQVSSFIHSRGRGIGVLIIFIYPSIRSFGFVDTIGVQYIQPIVNQPMIVLACNGGGYVVEPVRWLAHTSRCECSVDLLLIRSFCGRILLL